MKIALKTDIGRKRSSNQDYINKFANNAGYTLVVLADGLGGHRAGDIASQVAVTDLGRAWVTTDFPDWESIKEWLVTTIQATNQKIYDMGQNEDFKDMSTTLEAVALIGNFAVFAHVGDSKIGLVRGGTYQPLTRDHSYVNALIDLGEITPEEAEHHPKKNFILQSIGQKDPVSIDIGVQELEAGDYLLINSDGLTDMISTKDLEEVLAQDLSLSQKADLLVAKANDAGGLDNITLALVQVESEG